MFQSLIRASNKEVIKEDLYNNSELSYNIIKSKTRVFNLTSNDRTGYTSSSKGYQLKWTKDGFFIKLDLLGYESIAEILVSWLSKYIISDFEVLKYYPCIIIEDGIEKGFGCYSKMFTLDGYNEISIAKILRMNMRHFSISYDDLRLLLWDELGFDTKTYIDFILCLDSIVKNDDRHFSNISFLNKGDKIFYAPIFDNGSACLSDLISYPISETLEDNIKRVLAKPFKTQFKDQLTNNKLLYINYNEFINSVVCDNEYLKRAFEVILYGLNEMENISWTRV